MAFLQNSQNVINDSKVISAANLTVIAGSTESYIEVKSYSSPMYGTSYGFTAGSDVYNPPYNSPSYNVIDRFPFATNTNATDYGDLTVGRIDTCGQSSTTHGYVSGGQSDGPTTSNVIDRFPFAAAANASDVGDLTTARYRTTGVSSPTSGYVFSLDTSYEKFPFASSTTNASQIPGTSANFAQYSAGHSNESNGYTSGGPPTFIPSVNIKKFPFATDVNLSAIGSLSVVRYGVAGQSSTAHGYTSGGVQVPGFTNTNIIDRFPFATDTNATDVGDLYTPTTYAAGQSSTSNGYLSGGRPSVNIIQKFPFASSANSSDVGDLTVGRDTTGGQQD